MGKKTYTPEQIINKLREAEVHFRQGSTIGEASRSGLLLLCPGQEEVCVASVFQALTLPPDHKE